MLYEVITGRRQPVGLLLDPDIDHIAGSKVQLVQRRALRDCPCKFLAVEDLLVIPRITSYNVCYTKLLRVVFRAYP